MLLLWVLAGLLLVTSRALEPAVLAWAPRVALERAWNEGQLQEPRGFAPPPNWPRAWVGISPATWSDRWWVSNMRSELQGKEADPWGNPWGELWEERALPGGQRELALLPYSVGADGVDQKGKGDDVFVFPKSYALAPFVVAHAPGWLARVALALIWWAVIWPVLRLRSSWPAEGLQLVGAAGPPTALLAWNLGPVVELLEASRAGGWQLQLSLENSVTLSVAAANVLAALSARAILARQRDGALDSDSAT